MITSQGLGTWSSCPRCPLSHGTRHLPAQSSLVVSFCPSLASLFLLEAGLDPASSDAPKATGCGPVSGEEERDEVVVSPWEPDPPV